jgi:cellulose synthase/poly-beta-1,6-N-acetylglucosamine synthase-like glycosyltransferase
MSALATFATYSFLFVIVYFQVFLLITLFEDSERKSIKSPARDTEPYKDPATGEIVINPTYDYPTVTILIPVWNEEKTVEKTVDSLLALEYPKDKLNITIVDDGSKDNTWNLVQKFKHHPQITLHQKENGGKYTALNYGITHSKSTYIGCLDADSFVDSKALLHIIPHFSNPDIAAVTPSMKIQNPDTILGLVQNAEYNMGIFVRKVFALLDAQYVTPGPFSIFKKSVFDTVGLYKHAHNTEDLEMALRLQEQHYKIENADKAIVYTVGPRTLYKLYRQRVRWTGGFIQNALDYKKMILNPQYGNLGLLVLPIAMYAIVTTMIMLFYTVFNASKNLFEASRNAHTLGWKLNLENINWEWLVYNLKTPFFVGVAMTLAVIFTIWYGKRLAGVKDKKMIDIVYFLLLYSLISPLWLITSVYNTLRSKDAAWR